jgi:spore germination protein GerM
MVEPTGHCPYLGLKQNRAIRFSSPTPEHRCYVGGEPIEIPVDQASFCLARNHVECPLYMGLSAPTMADGVAARSAGAQSAPSGGLRGWLASLSPRDRAVYALMIGMLALIVLIYLAAGFQSLRGAGGVAGLPTQDAPTSVGAESSPTSPATGKPAASVTPSPEAPSATAVPATSTTAPDTPTALPTSTAEPEPSPAPTSPAVILEPTAAPTEASPRPSAVSATSAPSASPARPTSAPPAPTRAPSPAANVTTEILWLYFADATGSLYVPVQRAVPVENRRVAEAAIRELIAGPKQGLERLVLPDVRLLDVTIRGDTAIVNFDRPPNGAGDDRGLYSIVLTLTNLPNIEEVQILVNGRAYGLQGGAPIQRPVVNPLNPEKLPFDYRSTEFLPTYYVMKGSNRSVRIMRMVPKTRETAASTVQALLEGPGEYGYAVVETIPDSASLLDLTLESGVATVNFSETFTSTRDRQAAVRTVVESLTTLPGLTGVRFLVEGQSLGDYWGEPYGRVFSKPLINPE